MYNTGFAIFTLFSILLSVTWLHGRDAALFMIVMRLMQGVGGAINHGEHGRHPDRCLSPYPTRLGAGDQHGGRHRLGR